MALKAYQASDSSSANDKKSDKYTLSSAWVLLPNERQSIINEGSRLSVADVFKTTGVVSTDVHHRNDECAIWYPP